MICFGYKQIRAFERIISKILQEWRNLFMPLSPEGWTIAMDSSPDFPKGRQLMNAASRILTRARKSEHISPVLGSLLWLPDLFRI